MSTEYANLVDPQRIENNIDADYENEARLVQTAIATIDGVPEDGSHVSWVKNKLFAGKKAQAVGVGTEINIQSKEQEEYQMAIAGRGNGAELDGMFEAIRKKAARLSWTEREVQEEITNSITAALMTNAGQGLDDIGVAVIDGVSAFCKTGSINYNDQGGAETVSLTNINNTKALRGEAGTMFNDSGFIICTGVGYYDLANLGLIVSTGKTETGDSKQDRIVERGDIGLVLGMRPFVTDKISDPEVGTNKYVLIEQGALRMKRSPIEVTPPDKIARRNAYLQEYYFRAGAIVNGFSWTKAKSNLTTDADYADGSNYEVFVENNKNLPFAVLEVDKA